VTNHSPYKIDPERMRAIRRMESRDISDVARMHRSSMGRSLWGRMGLGFLRRMYAALLDQPEFLAFVYEKDGRVVGFIAGTSNGPTLMRQVLYTHPRQLGVGWLRAAVRHPRSALRVIAGLGYFGISKPGEEVIAESFFCSFEKPFQRTGAAGHINKVLFDELAWLGHSKVKVTIDSDNKAALEQLRSWHFEEHGSFEFYGKWMTVLVLDLKNSARVEARQWAAEG